MEPDNLNTDQAKQLLQQAWWAGIEAVNGYGLVKSELENHNYSNITHVLAIGKAASSMIMGAYDALEFFKGLCITKYGHADTSLKRITSIETIESSHPVPDENSLAAGNKAIKFIKSLSAQDNLLVLVSGGASALVELLPNNVTLKDLQLLNQRMLCEQKTIHEINKVRCKISLIKHGKLLNQCQADSITTLAISDVQGDDIKVIGSGIGACDSSNTKSKIVGSNQVARNTIANFFMDNGVQVNCNQESLYGDVYEQAKLIATEVIEGAVGAYIFGGEPTVSLPENPGQGGRNQAMALALAKEIYPKKAIVALLAGSDGSDGPTDAAGGLVDGETYSKVTGAEKALLNADSGTYLARAGNLFVTGPTGTNVMDLAIVIKSKK